MNKNQSFLKALAIVICAMAAISVQAVPTITGGVLFTGGSLTVDTGNLATATKFNSFSGSVVMFGSQSGSYASVPTGTAVTWTPFTFSLSLLPNPVNPLWTFTLNATDVYSFSATSVTVIQQSAGFLDVKGNGIAHIDGFSDTPGNWYIHSTGENTYFTFGAGTKVPDGGATVALLGIAVCGLGFLRRKIF